MFKTIIVPLDGSDLAEKGLPYALRLAHSLDADLTVLRVVEIPDYPGDPLQEEHIRAADKYLSSVKDWLASDRDFLHFTNQLNFSVLLGDPAEEICRYARQQDQSLVVMTTHGRNGFSRLLLGSVAGKVLHKIKSPVMLVKPFGVNSSQTFKEIMEAQAEPYANTFLKDGIKLLVPLDQSENSEAALKPAFELARQLKAELHLLKVNIPAENVFYGESIALAFSPEEVELREAKEREAASLYLGQVAQSANVQGVKPITHVVTGNPTEEIIAYANQIEPDLIVMATHARGELSRLIYGSVANRVFQLTHLPVLMVLASKPASKPAAKTTPAEEKEPARK